MSERRKSILACFAHPDDELGVASLVAQSVAQGARATLICTTNGDVGTVDEKYLRGYSSISELRLAELACATKLIGFTEVVTLGYRDSGMMGSEDNQRPESYWQVAPEAAAEQVAEVMRRVRPQVVITFNTFGAYGHPDHIKINRATLAAFEMLQSEPEHPEKLYYNTFSKASRARRWAWRSSCGAIHANLAATRISTSRPASTRSRQSRRVSRSQRSIAPSPTRRAAATPARCDESRSRDSRQGGGSAALPRRHPLARDSAAAAEGAHRARPLRLSATGYK